MTVHVIGSGGSGGGGASLSNNTPLANGTPAGGTGALAARDDHTHLYQGGGPKLPLGKYAYVIADEGGGSPVINREYVLGLMLGPQSFDRVAMKVGSAPDGSAPIMRIAVRADADGTPGAPSGEISLPLNGGTGWKTATVAWTHPGGVLWLSFVGQAWISTAPSMEGSGNTSAPPFAFVPLAAVSAGLDTIGFADNHVPVLGFQDSVSGAIPSTFINVSNIGSTMPATILRRSA